MQKPRTSMVRSRNARLNLARRSATKLVDLLDPGNRPDSDEGWSVLFAEIRDAAQDALQGAHEASAYHNCVRDENPPPSTSTTN